MKLPFLESDSLSLVNHFPKQLILVFYWDNLYQIAMCYPLYIFNILIWIKKIKKTNTNVWVTIRLDGCNCYDGWAIW